MSQTLTLILYLLLNVLHLFVFSDLQFLDSFSRNILCIFELLVCLLLQFIDGFLITVDSLFDLFLLQTKFNLLIVILALTYDISTHFGLQNMQNVIIYMSHLFLVPQLIHILIRHQFYILKSTQQYKSTQ